MPIYEYKCKKCSVVFEALVPHAETKTVCTECGSKQVQKQLSTFSASIASNTPIPCRDGSCPSSGKAGTGCSGGGCPFS